MRLMGTCVTEARSPISPMGPICSERSGCLSHAETPTRPYTHTSYFSQEARSLAQ